DNFEGARARVRQARALLEFLARSAAPEADAHGALLRKELDLLRGLPDYYLYHEYLAEVNAPVYFHEFAARAEARGLQYLGEATLRDMLGDHVPADADEMVRRLAPGLVQAEQYRAF